MVIHSRIKVTIRGGKREMNSFKKNLPTKRNSRLGGGLLENRKPEDLKQFNKNKKQKQIIIGSIIAIVLIIGGISLYRSFAIYEEKETFDVLKGTIPDFRKVYEERILYGAYPTFDENEELIPVEIGENGKVTKANLYDAWYSYEEQRWANAVILNATGKAQTIEPGTQIQEEWIESYFVWIPKYRYKIWDLGLYNTANLLDSSKVHPIEIEFGLENTKDENENECTTPTESGGKGSCTYEDYMTHPAFLAFENTTGFWVGKFETGYKDATSFTMAQQNKIESNKVIIKPNVYSWRGINIYNVYNTSYNYKRDLDSHLIKNTEWGAVTYLSHSKYGACDGDSCAEIRINNNSNYVTGYSAKNKPTCGYNKLNQACNIQEGTGLKTNGTYGYHYGDNSSQVASTTGNYSGIYDMSGCAWEYVMGYLDGYSGLSNIELKYYDKYLSNAINTQFSSRILGDATGELGPFQVSSYDNTFYNSSWHNNFAMLFTTDRPYLIRGASYHFGTNAGLFTFINAPTFGDNNIAFRIVLSPEA